MVSAVLQTPVGFLVDRTDARLNLIGGLLLGAAAIAVAAVVDSFWVFVAMFGVLGLANTVFHPADYALLSEHVAPERMTQVFSYHTCAGMVGSAIAPVTLLYMQGFVGWRGAFLGASAARRRRRADPGAAARAAGGPPLAAKPRTAETAKAPADGWALLLSPPILINLALFLLLSMVGGGLNQYLVVGLAALHGTPLTSPIPRSPAYSR